MAGPVADRVCNSTGSSSSSSGEPATGGAERPDEMRSRLEVPRMLVIAVIDNVAVAVAATPVAGHDARGASDQSDGADERDEGRDADSDFEPKTKDAKGDARPTAGGRGDIGSLRGAAQTVHSLAAAASHRRFGAAPIEMVSYAAVVERIVAALVRQPLWSVAGLDRCCRRRRDPDAPLYDMPVAMLRLRLRAIVDRDGADESARWKAAWRARVDRALLRELSGSTWRQWAATVCVELLAVFLVAVSFVALLVHADEPSPLANVRVTDFFHEQSPFVASTRDAVATDRSCATIVACTLELVAWATLVPMTPQFLGVVTTVLAVTERPISLSAFIVLRLAVFAGGMRLSWFFVALAVAWHQLEAPAAAWYLRHSRVTPRHSAAELRAAIARHLRALGRSELAWAEQELARICRVAALVVERDRDREAGAGGRTPYAPGISVCVDGIEDARRLVEHYTGPSYALRRARSGVRFFVVARDAAAVRREEEEKRTQWYSGAARSTARLVARTDCFCDEPQFVTPDAVLQYDANAAKFSRSVSGALGLVSA